MNLKIVLILIVIGAIAIASVMILVSQNKTTVTPVSESSDLKSNTEISSTPNLKDYIDPSGFSFSYPAELEISSEENLAPVSYAKLILTFPETGAAIDIHVADSKEKSVKEIIKKRGVKGETKKINLADIDGLQYKIATQVATLALDEGVLFEITLNKANKSDEFDSIYNDLIASFVFEKPDTSAPQQQEPAINSSSEDVVFEGEELIE